MNNQYDPEHDITVQHYCATSTGSKPEFNLTLANLTSNHHPNCDVAVIGQCSREERGEKPVQCCFNS